MSIVGIVAHVILASTLVIMGATIVQTIKLLDILRGSKAEPIWKRSQLAIILLTIFYILIMISSLLAQQFGTGFLDSGSYHELIMNSSFLLTSIILFTLVNLDIRAFSSLFELLEEPEKTEV